MIIAVLIISSVSYTHLESELKKKRLVFQLFLLICMLIGLLITLYPFYSDSLNGFIDQKRIEQAQQISIKKKEKLKVQMQEENQQKVEAGLAPGVDPFDNQLTDTHSSAQLIGAVNIPKINVNVALYDTLNQRVLEKGAGVLQLSLIHISFGNKPKFTKI